jgi:DNA recombination protein RmuC
MEIIIAIAAFLAGLIASFLFLKTRMAVYQKKLANAEASAAVWQSQVAEKGLQLGELKEELRTELNRNGFLQTELTRTETDLHHIRQRLTEQKTELESLRTTFLQQFTSVSNQVLLANTNHFNKASAENLQKVLEPLKERIREFETKVDNTYEKSFRENITLKEQISQLANLNQQMSQDALNLTKALKGERKTQGNWGEYLLEVLLEKSGLKKDEHYRREAVLYNDNRQQYRPDVIVNLPGNKHLVIDSKVSLSAYENYCSCEDEMQRQVFLKSHINAIRNHYQELSKKEYHLLAGLHSPDFVLMFIPVEPAFNLAMEHDREIFLDALNRNIVFVTTSTLLATLKTVEGVWRQESQKENVLRIARESGLLYDKFAGFVDDLKAIGKSIEGTRQSYQAAMSKLTEGKGNLVRKAERLKKLGARTQKSIDNTILKEAEAEAEI